MLLDCPSRVAENRGVNPLATTLVVRHGGRDGARPSLRCDNINRIKTFCVCAGIILLVVISYAYAERVTEFAPVYRYINSEPA